MADIDDRDRAGRRRRKRTARKPFEEREMPPVISKPTIILAKPPSERNQNQSNGNLINHALTPESYPALPNGLPASPNSTPSKAQPQVLMIKTRDEPRPPDKGGTSSVQSIPSLLAGEGAHGHHPRPQGEPPGVRHDGPGRLAAPVEMTQALKLVDDCLQWCDNGLEMLLDQTDFLVVGVIGQQGVGKSTIMSMLAGNDMTNPYRTFAFRPQNREAREIGSHQTIGVDMFVTGERMILLDTQPILSAAVLDHMIHSDRKYPAEYTSAENCIEMQSLQITSFMLTVCNLILVVMDWFADVNLLRFLQTAEMLKPASPSPSQEGGTEDSLDYYPNIAFVVNKSGREDFAFENEKQMKTMLGRLMKKSRLKFKGPIGNNTSKNGKAQNDLNLFLVPVNGERKKETSGEGNSSALSLLEDYKGHPSFKQLMRKLRNQIFSVPRKQLTHTILSEKNWFHYAARTWEAVKKSALISEYNRLLP